MLRSSKSNFRLGASMLFLALSLTGSLLVSGPADAQFGSCNECAIGATVRCGRAPAGGSERCSIFRYGGELFCVESGNPCGF